MPSIAPSERAGTVPFSGIRRVYDRITQLEAQGRSVVNLCIGRPDFDTPEHIKEAARRALTSGHVHYTPNAGVPVLREAIAQKLKRENSVDVDPDGGVIVTVGGTEALLITLIAYLNAGDEVLIPSPGWLSYYHMTTVAGGTPVPVPMIEREGEFIMDLDRVEKAIGPRTRAMILNDPHNPTGGVLGDEHRRGLVELARRHGILLLDDEIYERLTYDGHQHVSLASLPGAEDVAVIINGFSKAYSMTGWRIGYVAGHGDLLSPILKIHQYTVVCATSFAQYGAAEALTASQECVQAMLREFDARRRLMVEGLNEIPGITCARPLGAFYVFPCIRGWGMDSRRAAEYLLEKCGVGGVAGESFGAEGRDYIRLSYATSRPELEEALVRIGEGAKRLGL